MNFRIVGLLSDSIILAHPRSLSPDGCSLCGKRKAACALLPATDLTPAQVIRPRLTAIHRPAVSQDSRRRCPLVLALSKQGGARKPTKTVAGVAAVLVSFARHGRSKPQSFPRKRESTRQTFRNALSTDWIPAFAGMTGVSKRIPSQMTPPGRAVRPVGISNAV